MTRKFACGTAGTCAVILLLVQTVNAAAVRVEDVSGPSTAFRREAGLLRLAAEPQALNFGKISLSASPLRSQECACG